MTSDLDPIQVRARELVAERMGPLTAKQLPPSDELLRECIAQAEQECACPQCGHAIERHAYTIAWRAFFCEECDCNAFDPEASDDQP